MEPLKQLGEHGQSVWFDFIRRDLVRDGGLAQLVRDGVRGVTSNPSIFEKAIGGSDEYDDALRAALEADATISPLALFEAVAIEDIRGACDVLQGVYADTAGHDGYVSLEVSPALAHDAEGTVRQARRLWKAVDRPNLMIKVPATAEGVPAFEQLIAEGINVNVTLMFSLQHYEDVAQAYIRGLRRTPQPASIASVASFFVSRVETAVDRQLDAIGTEEARRLRGTAAIANSKLAYRRYQEIFEGPGFADLAARGARPQRVLWASTSTKDPAYRDVIYVEELVGDNTVNTMPPDTVEAFKDHGVSRAGAVTEDVEGAAAAIEGLAELGIDFDAITQQLQLDGVAAFAASFESMLATIADKSEALLAAAVDSQELVLGSFQTTVDERLDAWTANNTIDRLWSADHTVWVDEPRPELTDRLGWLRLTETMRPHLEDIRWFTDEVRSDGFTDVVLLGMGGSSLAPEVFARTFGRTGGYPALHVLDSTHPDAIRALDARIDPATTLFLVASKSGTTIEPLSFLEHYWARVTETTAQPGRHFAAITDPDTPLVELARERGFRKVFATIADVGGRYSALTHFGLVPAALIGADITRLLDRAARVAAASRRRPADNPAASLGAAIGELALAGRDKATFYTSPSLSAMPDWIEQLIAESTGKEGTGILPIAGEQAIDPGGYGSDRCFVYLSYTGDEDAEQAGRIDALAAAGHPVVRIEIDELSDVAGEMFRAEVATAMAGAVLHIHPFDQPNVQLAKELARQAMAGSAADDPITAVAPDAADQLGRFLEQAEPGDYIAIQAFIAPGDEAHATLQAIRHDILTATGLATTVGFGPRFLHSTGQFHKGGTNTGLFVQIVDSAANDLPVPGANYTFGRLIRGQADGDYQALVDAGRRVIRVDLGDDTAPSLAALRTSIRG